jgi:hypothetical protein
MARSAIEAGRLQSVVAIDPEVGVVAHMSLQPRVDRAGIAELGNTVVDPRFRGRTLTPRLTGELIGRCRSLGLVGFIHYPTTAHLAMQKMAARGGGIELGGLLDRPESGFATEALAELEFFYGAILPEYLPGTDVLRLQRIEGECLKPPLETARSRELFAYSMQDSMRDRQDQPT